MKLFISVFIYVDGKVKCLETFTLFIPCDKILQSFGNIRSSDFCYFLEYI